MDDGPRGGDRRTNSTRDTPTIVVALGGNTIARFGDEPTVAAQYRRATEAMREVAALARTHTRLVLTHGNGPVVGNIVLRSEIAGATIPPTPLFIADADSEGGIGLMLQQVLGNELKRAGFARTVATLVTQVIVDGSDPAFSRPTKPIGPYYAPDQALRLAAERGWTFAEEPGRGVRRVVPSPRPVKVVETPAVSALLNAGVIPIAAGGGGVPVIAAEDGTLSGVDVVVDKDWTAATLAAELGAELLVIMMEADAFYDGFGTPRPRRVERLDAARARDLATGLPSGTIGPKIAAAAWLAERGVPTLLCGSTDLAAALAGHSGTRIEPA